MSDERKGSTRGFRVLVLDDDPIALKSLTYTLENAGMNVWALPSPFGLSRMVLEHEIEVIVMDLMMPALRGDRVVGMLRENPRLANVPVVIVSGESEDALREVAVRASVAVASKQRVAYELVPTVRRLAVSYRSGAAASAGGHRPASVPPIPGDDVEAVPAAAAQGTTRLDDARAALLEGYLGGLPARVVKLNHAWAKACEGDLEHLERVRRDLHSLKGEAYLLSHGPLARLLEQIEAAVKAAQSQASIPTCLESGVRAALNVVHRIARAGDQPGAVDVEAAIARIDQARELSFSEPGRKQWDEVAQRARLLLRSLIPPSSGAM